MHLHLTSHGCLAANRVAPSSGSSNVVSRSEESMALRRCWSSYGQTKGGSSYLTDVQLAGYIAHSAMSRTTRPRNTTRPRYAATAERLQSKMRGVYWSQSTDGCTTPMFPYLRNYQSTSSRRYLWRYRQQVHVQTQYKIRWIHVQ